MGPSGGVPVWDVVQRLLHWALAAAVALCWWAGEQRLSLHIACGYVALAAAASRTLWGLLGSAHARFTDFVRGPRGVLGYAGLVLRSREPRYLGHNPLGGWMVLALLIGVAVVCVTGILYTTDRFWGEAWVELAHRASAWTLVGLVALHVAGVVFTSWRHGENLVAAMFSGRKRAGGADGADGAGVAGQADPER